VQDDAKLAMIGIALSRMDMRHLDHSQQRQQDKTHQRDRRPNAWLGTEIPAEMCPKSSQDTPSLLRIHIIGCSGSLRGYAVNLILG